MPWDWNLLIITWHFQTYCRGGQKEASVLGMNDAIALIGSVPTGRPSFLTQWRDGGSWNREGRSAAGNLVSHVDITVEYTLQCSCRFQMNLEINFCICIFTQRSVATWIFIMFYYFLQCRIIIKAIICETCSSYFLFCFTSRLKVVWGTCRF